MSCQRHAAAAAQPSHSTPLPPLPPAAMLQLPPLQQTPHAWQAPALQVSAAPAPAAPPPAADMAELATAAAAATAAPAAGGTAAEAEREVAPGVYECWWHWHGRCVRYLRSGASGPAVVCVHGFCANADHWRHNLPALGQHCRVFALDLLGGLECGVSCHRTAGGPAEHTARLAGQQITNG